VQVTSNYRYSATEVATGGDRVTFATKLQVPSGVSVAKLVLRRLRLPDEIAHEDADPLEKVILLSSYCYLLPSYICGNAMYTIIFV
jgi:hypothetical protein